MADKHPCADCGNPAVGVRCKNCWPKYASRMALIDTAAEDRRILGLLADGMRRSTLALELGISRTQTRTRILNAQAREKKRKKLGIADGALQATAAGA